MAEPTMQQVLDRLEAQHATIARLQREVIALRPHRRRPRLRRRLPLLLVALAVALLPLGALADFAFLDLDPASPHNDNIAALKAAGITKGCDPPAYVQYCPKDTVTREEMASFLARTAGLGGNAPVVNAKTARTADTAGSAATLGGYAPNALLRVAHSTSPEGNTEFTVAYPAWATARTVQLVAPGAGFVLVVGSVTLATNATPAGCATGVCLVYARLRDPAPGGAVSPLVTAAINADGPDQTLATTFVFPLAAPGPRSYLLEITKNAGAGATTRAFGAAQLTALYVPFGYDGGTILAP